MNRNGVELNIEGVAAEVTALLDHFHLSVTDAFPCSPDRRDVCVVVGHALVDDIDEAAEDRGLQCKMV